MLKHSYLQIFSHLKTNSVSWGLQIRNLCQFVSSLAGILMRHQYTGIETNKHAQVRQPPSARTNHNLIRNATLKSRCELNQLVTFESTCSVQAHK